MKHLTEVRYGFIGAGAIAHSGGNSLSSNKDAKLVAVYDVHQGRAQALQEKFKFKTVHKTLEALLGADDIDAVYIATPNKFHAPLAKQALLAGKHVLLEKPFALSYAEAKEVVDLAASKKLTFMLGMNQRFNADSQRIKQVVEAGDLGEIYHAKAYWVRRTGIPKLGTWFGNRELAGGGSINDIGVHMLDLCLYTMNNFEPVSVVGATYSKFGNRGLGEGGWGMSDDEKMKFDVDDFASAFIRLSNGATVTLDTSWACHKADGNRDNVDLFGTEAGASMRPAKLFRFGKDKSSAYEIVDEIKTPVKLAHCDRFHHFTNHLIGKEELIVTTKQALTVQKVLDAINESNRTGKEVRLA